MQNATAAWAGIAVALLVGVLGVFREELQRLWRRPRLAVLDFEKDPVSIERSPRSRRSSSLGPPTPSPGWGSASWYWIRLPVRNGERRSAKAEEVEVYVEGVEKESVTRSYEKKTDHLGFNMLWSWGEATTHADLLPGATKFLHVGHLVHPDGRSEGEFPDYHSDRPEIDRSKAFFVLAASPRNPNFDYVLEPGHYRLHLALGGKNAGTRPVFDPAALQRRMDGGQAADTRLGQG